MISPPEPISGGRWLSVWPTGQDTVAGQLPAGTTGGGMPSAVAAHAIAAYTHPGAIVVDPDCAGGVVLAEAVRTGRHAIGSTTDPSRWELARATVTASKSRGAPGDGMVLDQLPHGRSWIAWPLADLVLTMIHRRSAAGFGDIPAGELGLTRRRPPPDWLHALLAAYRNLARVEGRLVIVTPPGVGGIPPSDLASQVLTVGRRVGLLPVERAAALTSPVRNGVLAVTLDAARTPTTGRSRAHPTHLDVIVFRRVEAASLGLRLTGPTPSAITALRPAAGGHRPTWRTYHAA
ncbi:MULTISPECIES: SAM-dependent methyltransferase [unclassified Frankia]|uniref:SAM-dependent methyltransferase n=1 Tax=unclassified Frankia TaxID=2632575 RepID=UPI002AD57331|nr:MULTISPECIES: SAM-dependent methyltransferase [unclassified Frankia]